MATVKPSDMASKFEQVHNQCQGRVCVCCYRKGDRIILSEEVECIDSNLIEGYTVKDPDFPSALCTDCHIELNKKINGNGYHLVPKVDDYDPGRSLFATFIGLRVQKLPKITGLAYQRMIKKKRKTSCSRENNS